MPQDRLEPGSLDDLDDTMAGAMLDAYNDLLEDAGFQTVPDDGSSRLLFVAIARGVVEHLEAREEAFEITIKTEDPS